MQVVQETNITEFPLAARDDVRDIYDLSENKQLVVYTDRLTVQGARLGVPLPFKGLTLYQINSYWMSRFTHLVSNYLVTQKMVELDKMLAPYEQQLKGRSAIVRKVRPLPLLFRVIGCLSGEHWKTYAETGGLCGQMLPRGLKECKRLEKPLLVMETRGDLCVQGEDMVKWMQRMFGLKLYQNIADTCLSIFGVARNYALARGIMISDTAFEFGVENGSACLINEVMTPDSSSYWEAENCKPGQSASFEKQYLSAWLAQEDWDPSKPLPPVPQSVMNKTIKAYQALYNIMTGKVALRKAEGVPEQPVR